MVRVRMVSPRGDIICIFRIRIQWCAVLQYRYLYQSIRIEAFYTCSYCQNSFISVFLCSFLPVSLSCLLISCLCLLCLVLSIQQCILQQRYLYLNIRIEVFYICSYCQSFLFLVFLCSFIPVSHCLLMSILCPVLGIQQCILQYRHLSIRISGLKYFISAVTTKTCLFLFSFVPFFLSHCLLLSSCLLFFLSPLLVSFVHILPPVLSSDSKERSENFARISPSSFTPSHSLNSTFFLFLILSVH